MESIFTYIPKEFMWHLVLFGAGWQFLRWLFLTKWLVKNIEHWIAYIVKLLLNQALAYAQMIMQFIIESIKPIIREIWKYMAGKIAVILSCLYLLYHIIF
jgi:hypothetical protein